jgi:colicin import membrane protein
MAQKKHMQWQAMLFTVALHLGLIGIVYLSSVWVFTAEDQPSSGQPVQATLSFSADDLAKAKKAVRKAELAAKDIAPSLQETPSPRPQTATEQQQQVAQNWVDNPQQVNQEAIIKNAAQSSDTLQEQVLKQKQGQVELTEDVKKDLAEENRQRLIQQRLDAVKKQRVEAARQAQIAEQRLDELAAGAGKKTPNKTPAEPEAGQSGANDALRSKYISAVNATARSNWNTVQIPQQTRCQVEFTQIRGGEVIEINFLVCSLDGPGRESVERALYKTPMPYTGFEAVFQRKVVLTFCYPNEVCR